MTHPAGTLANPPVTPAVPSESLEERVARLAAENEQLTRNIGKQNQVQDERIRRLQAEQNQANEIHRAELKGLADRAAQREREARYQTLTPVERTNESLVEANNRIAALEQQRKLDEQSVAQRNYIQSVVNQAASNGYDTKQLDTSSVENVVISYNQLREAAREFRDTARDKEIAELKKQINRSPEELADAVRAATGARRVPNPGGPPTPPVDPSIPADILQMDADYQKLKKLNHIPGNSGRAMQIVRAANLRGYTIE